MPRPKLTPQIAYNLAEALYNASGERDERLESVIAQDASWACYYAKYVLQSPWPEAAQVIAQDAYWAYEYARAILKTPWPKGEPAIAQIPIYEYLYTENVLKTPEDLARFREIQRCHAQN